MNYFTKQALSIGIKMLIGSDWWSTVVDAVKKAASDSTLSGAQKRENVFEAIKASGWKLANVILNVAIEIAVLFFKDSLNALKSE